MSKPRVVFFAIVLVMGTLAATAFIIIAAMSTSEQVSNATFIKLIENSKITMVEFTSDHDEVRGYSPKRKKRKIFYTIAEQRKRPEESAFFMQVKKYRAKVKIFVDYQLYENF